MVRTRKYHVLMLVIVLLLGIGSHYYFANLYSTANGQTSGTGPVWTLSNWQKSSSNPVITPTKPYENVEIGEPSILYQNGVFKMWYNSEGSGLAYATSTDGVNFIKYGIVYGNSSTAFGTPYVAIGPTGYYLFYENGGASMSEAISPNGISNWVSYGTVIQKGLPGSWDSNYILNAAVKYDSNNNRFVMLAEGGGAYGSQIGYFNSTDGIHWNAYPRNPIKMGTGNNGCPELFQWQGYWYSLYCNMGDRPYWQISGAYSTDLINWTQFPNNPIVTVTQSWENINGGGIADPSIAITPNGQVYLYYIGDQRYIGLATTTLAL